MVVFIPCDPDQPIEARPLPVQLADQQSMVGGYIELVRLSEQTGLWVDEDGLMKKLRPNRRASAVRAEVMRISGSHPSVPPIVGDAVLVGLGGADFMDFPDVLISGVEEMIGQKVVRLDGQH